MQILLFILCPCFIKYLNGFLLDGSSTTNGTVSAAATQFITVPEFLEYENQQLKTVEQLRGMMERTWATLTSQLNEKFRTLETNVAVNDSEKLGKLEKTVTDLHQEVLLLKTENKRLKRDLNSVLNSSLQFRQRISELERSDRYQYNFNVSSLLEQLENVKAETITIKQNQMARSQDFLALHNDTVNLKQSVSEFKTTTIEQFELFSNKTEDMEQKRKTKYAFFVGFKSDQRNLPANTVLKFDDIKLNTHGCYNNITGKFTAPDDGFYSFSWTTVSYPYSDFTSVLVHDGIVVAANPVDNESSTDYMTGSSTVVLEMKVGQCVWVRVPDNDGRYLYANWNIAENTCSMFSGFKI